MDELLTAVFQRQHGVITRGQALAEGLTGRQIDRRVATGEWVVEARGVYRHRLIGPTWRGRVLATCFALGAVASHRTAATLHGIEGFRPGRVEVVVACGRWKPPADVILHQSTQMDRVAVEIIDAIPCTGLSRTVLDIAAVVPRWELEHTVDAVIRDHGLDLAALYDVLARHARKGRDGCGRLREVLDGRMGVGTVPLSRWSRMVADLLVARSLPKPQMEFVVRDPSGDFLGQVDLAYPEHKVAIELDSIRWHLNRESFEKDPERRNRLTVAGWAVLNFTWRRYVDDPSGLCREVRSAISRF